MNIAVLGAGIVGRTLGCKWAQAGHCVMFGVRNALNPDVQHLANTLGAAVGGTGEAISFGDVVVFTIPGHAMDETLQKFGPALRGKVALDAANRMGGGAMNSAESFARFAPDAHLYRAFNSLGWENFEDPVFGDTQADLLYCGPQGEAHADVEQLVADIGLRPVRVGDINQVQLVDTIASLWFALAQGQKLGRHLAFKVLTR